MFNVAVFTVGVRAKRLLPVAAASIVLLTGCGVQGLQWHPGVAATVGDQTITDDRIDELATGFCTALEPQLRTQNQAAPLGVFRSTIVRGLVTRAAAEQVADDFEVGPDDAYRQAVSQAQAQTSQLSRSAGDAYVELQTLTAYLSSVAQAIGDKVLADQGQTDPTANEASGIGQQVIASWIASNDVEISPAYDAAIRQGQVVPADTDVSYPVSSAAKDGYDWLTSTSPDLEYAASLPANQVCG